LIDPDPHLLHHQIDVDGLRLATEPGLELIEIAADARNKRQVCDGGRNQKSQDDGETEDYSGFYRPEHDEPSEAREDQGVLKGRVAHLRLRLC
jgi:hypothetical protein